MVDIACDHFLDDFVADVVVVVGVPAGEFVEDVEAHVVAGVEEVLVGRVVGHADGVHVHLRA